MDVLVSSRRELARRAGAGQLLVVMGFASAGALWPDRERNTEPLALSSTGRRHL